MPVPGGFMLGQDTHAQAGRIDQPDSALFCEAGQHAVHICIDQVCSGNR